MPLRRKYVQTKRLAAFFTPNHHLPLSVKNPAICCGWRVKVSRLCRAALACTNTFPTFDKDSGDGRAERAGTAAESGAESDPERPVLTRTRNHHFCSHVSRSCSCIRKTVF